MEKVSESSGMNLLRPIAVERLKDRSKRDRIWSDNLESWGFFADTPTDEDTFLFCCNATPGDRLIISSGDGSSETYTIVGIWREKEKELPMWSYKLMDHSGKLTKIQVQERVLFTQAWEQL